LINYRCFLFGLVLIFAFVQAGRPAFLKTLRELGVDEGVDFQETIGKTCSGPRHDLICGKGSTSVSETPQELTVALLDLKPSMLKG
jgi:hypothetical protein